MSSPTITHEQILSTDIQHLERCCQAIYALLPLVHSWPIKWLSQMSIWLKQYPQDVDVAIQNSKQVQNQPEVI